MANGHAGDLTSNYKLQVMAGQQVIVRAKMFGKLCHCQYKRIKSGVAKCYHPVPQIR
jgi:hypothetical protein